MSRTSKTPEELWDFFAVYDGHGGRSEVDFVEAWQIETEIPDGCIFFRIWHETWSCWSLLGVSVLAGTQKKQVILATSNHFRWGFEDA